jgi:hypothetical protein
LRAAALRIEAYVPFFAYSDERRALSEAVFSVVFPHCGHEMRWRYLIVISSMHFHDKLTCASSEGCEAFDKQRAACHAASMPSPEVSP